MWIGDFFFPFPGMTGVAKGKEYYQRSSRGKKGTYTHSVQRKNDLSGPGGREGLENNDGVDAVAAAKEAPPSMARARPFATGSFIFGT